ncbi:PAT1-like protein 1 [Auxenochlorella protothecoides]|uniref:PAT1-like protein 1 n=1 Tax=Auxenochlorella protothecoides TaxID=3075 RepID=A0A087SDM0_AUXPR|nr:PAT1-like protein 1 [Auxenochlorella protothecoides]KFM23824.1 PAT1-like protein 1 [Auxenochlorella protothecoides]
MSGLQGDDGFVGATVTRDEGLPDDFFDASAYSFFGTTGDDVGGLEGELELGLEGPPEEESCVVEDDDYYLGYHAEGASDEEDLSLASLYAVAGVSTQVLPKPAAEPAPPVPAPPPPRPSGSIALGGLLAAGGDRAFYTPSPPAAGARSLESRPGSGGPPLSTSLLGQGPLPPEPQPSTYYQDQGGAFQDPSVVAGAPGLLRHQQALAGYAAAPPPPVGMTASALEASLLARSAEPQPPPLGPPSGHPSLYMSSNEIDGILYTQWRGLQQGPPYVEDYYFQGFVYKYYNRKNRRFFAPESVRELAPTEKLSADQVAFVHLDGLGRVPFSNIRRPRPLMELGGGPGVAEEGAEAGPGAPARSRRRRLDQEPLLAARIMIEDCMSLILDVQDIDQIFVAAAGYPIQDEAALRSRRQLLLEGLSASLRLPDAPGARRAAPDPGAPGDAVFRRLMGLRKGRTLAARALRVTFPPAEERQRPLPLARAAPNLRLLWAVLRGAGVLWSDPGGGVAEAADELAASARLADAAAEVLAALPAARMLADAAVALAAGLAEGTAASLQAPGALAAPVPAPETPWLGGAVLALEGGEAGALSAALEGLRA